MTDLPVVQYATSSDVGMRRAANQDSYVVRTSSDPEEWFNCGHLFVVADGMGGHAVGDLASRITVDTLPLAYFKQEVDTIGERLNAAIVAANQAINDKARENPEFADMGTTCSTLVLSRQGAFVGHVGDSRVYRVRQGRIEQLSFDHSLQWEMVRQGRATIENVDLLHPRNVITRCLGPDQNVRIDIEGPFDVAAGDQFVICSDGLTGHLSDTEIGAVASSMPPPDAARLLTNLANCRGGADNITVVVINVERYPAVGTQVVDSPAATTTSVARNPSFTRPSPLVRMLSSRAILFVFLLLGTLGLVLLAFKQIALGLVLICPALLLGFVRMIVVTSQPDAGDSVPEMDVSDVPEASTDSGPARFAPYTAASAEVTMEFVNFLAEVQSELTQAATENGWKADVEQLSDLNRRALQAVEKKALPTNLRLRAQAIKGLMKELYQHARRS